MAALDAYRDTLTYVNDAYSTLVKDYSAKLENKASPYSIEELTKLAAGFATVSQRLDIILNQYKAGEVATRETPTRATTVIIYDEDEKGEEGKYVVEDEIKIEKVGEELLFQGKEIPLVDYDPDELRRNRIYQSLESFHEHKSIEGNPSMMRLFDDIIVRVDDETKFLPPVFEIINNSVRLQDGSRTFNLPTTGTGVGGFDFGGAIGYLAGDTDRDPNVEWGYR